ncbi:hypothetical protein C8R44DRAFT_738129 [Mycena epipterygia]|nr:hypothetical protein C8R44DRAFT_738129 [Mycena epipterygia]
MSFRNLLRFPSSNPWFNCLAPIVNPNLLHRIAQLVGIVHSLPVPKCKDFRREKIHTLSPGVHGAPPPCTPSVNSNEQPPCRAGRKALTRRKAGDTVHRGAGRGYGAEISRQAAACAAPAPLLTAALGVGPEWTWRSSQAFPTFPTAPRTPESAVPLVWISDDEEDEPVLKIKRITHAGQRHVKADKNNVEDAPTLMYGVGSHNRIFCDRAYALQALKRTPSADLFFSYDEHAIGRFIEEEAARMSA